MIHEKQNIEVVVKTPSFKALALLFYWLCEFEYVI